MKKIVILFNLLFVTLVAATTIYDIQFTTSPNGNSSFDGENVITNGIVTAIGYNSNYFFISEPVGGAWRGIYIYSSENGIQIGDEIEVSGTVSEYYGFTEIINADIEVISSNNQIPDPVEISTSELASQEMYESVLAKIVDVSVTQLPDNYGQWYVDDGSGDCQIDDEIYEYFPQMGEFFPEIIGVIDYSYNEFGLNPRNQNDISDSSFEDLEFGSDETFDIVTWNIEEFPKNGQNTIDLVSEVIETLNVDFIAIQEIADIDEFQNLVDNLDGWDGYCANSAYLVNLAFLYKIDEISILNTSELFPNNSYHYPRFPLVAEITWNETNLYIINNHLKAMDDAQSEERRRQACIGLENYISQYHSDENVILLGDLNDSLTDNEESNVFQCFLDEPQIYQFADMSIATGSENNWSLPSYNPAHFDHILITDELFDAFDDSDSEVRTIKVDLFLDGGWEEYDDNISNHRPVGLKLDINNTENFDDVVFASNDFSLNNYPNPFNPSTTITFDLAIKNFNDTELTIYNLKGQAVKTFRDVTLNSDSNGKGSVVWNGKDDRGISVSSGIYFYKLKSGNKSITKSMLIVK